MGIVSEILVEEGDTVNEGQTLVVLDDTRADATFSLFRGQYRSAEALKARLEAERDGLEQVRYPHWLRTAVQQAGTDDYLATQNRIFRARTKSVENRTAIYGQRIAQMREEIAGLTDEFESQVRHIALLDEEIESIRRLVKKGFEGKSRLLALERSREVIAGKRALNRGRIARVRQRIGEARLAIDELGIQRQNEVVAELREVETRISDLREQMSAARDELSRTRVTAPVAGTVVNLRVFTHGGVIRAGQRLMDIVPTGSELVIEARVATTDIDSVYRNLPAQVRLTAFSHLTTPPLNGTVLRVSADRFTDERTGVGVLRGPGRTRFRAARARGAQAPARHAGGGDDHHRQDHRARLSAEAHPRKLRPCVAGAVIRPRARECEPFGYAPAGTRLQHHFVDAHGRIVSGSASNSRPVRLRHMGLDQDGK